MAADTDNRSSSCYLVFDLRRTVNAEPKEIIANSTTQVVASTIKSNLRVSQCCPGSEHKRTTLSLNRIYSTFYSTEPDSTVSLSFIDTKRIIINRVQCSGQSTSASSFCAVQSQRFLSINEQSLTINNEFMLLVSFASFIVVAVHKVGQSLRRERFVRVL